MGIYGVSSPTQDSEPMTKVVLSQETETTEQTHLSEINVEPIETELKATAVKSNPERLLMRQKYPRRNPRKSKNPKSSKPRLLRKNRKDKSGQEKPKRAKPKASFFTKT